MNRSCESIWAGSCFRKKHFMHLNAPSVPSARLLCWSGHLRGLSFQADGNARNPCQSSNYCELLGRSHGSYQISKDFGH